MLTKDSLQKKLNTHPLIIPRLKTLDLAQKINPQFNTPHITGGYLRNVALDRKPNDCDVVFKGYQLEQPGIIEAVREAEATLEIEPYPEWDFENSMATGQSKDFYENIIGSCSNHTDYLTVLAMNTKGELFIGENKVLEDIENRTYDFRFEGIEVWAKHRGQGRTYESCLVGDLTRGLYLCSSLDLHPSLVVDFLMKNYDMFFNQLDEEDQTARQSYWMKKTKGDKKFQEVLNKYKINSLNTL